MTTTKMTLWRTWWWCRGSRWHCVKLPQVSLCIKGGRCTPALPKEQIQKYKNTKNTKIQKYISINWGQIPWTLGLGFSWQDKSNWFLFFHWYCVSPCIRLVGWSGEMLLVNGEQEREDERETISNTSLSSPPTIITLTLLLFDSSVTYILSIGGLEVKKRWGRNKTTKLLILITESLWHCLDEISEVTKNVLVKNLQLDKCFLLGEIKESWKRYQFQLLHGASFKR